jgi:hypothetical protein
LVDALEAQIINANLIQPAVSSANVGWHIEHSCLVITKIIQTVEQSNPAAYQWKWNMMRVMVFILGKFPRGRAEAPASVLPAEAISAEHLLVSIQETRNAIAKLSGCSKNQYFKHPFFGELNKSATLYFLGIHTKHHLHIIEDILK